MATASRIDQADSLTDLRLLEALNTVSGCYASGYTCHSLRGFLLEPKTCGVVHETILEAERHAFVLNRTRGYAWSPGLIFRPHSPE